METLAVLFIVGLPRLPYRVWGLGVGFRIYKGLRAKHGADPDEHDRFEQLLCRNPRSNHSSA